MKNFRIKFLAALLSFTVGISAFYLISSVHPYVIIDTFNSITPNLPEKKTLDEPKKEFSNKIEIRFVGFVQGERQVEAEFEITNSTAEAVYFKGYSKNDYAFPTLKRDGKVVPDNRFRCGSGLKEQALSSGETVFFQVPKSEVTREPTEDSWRETDKPTQIGFSFEIGNRPFVRLGNRHWETLWSEEIKFPN